MNINTFSALFFPIILCSSSGCHAGSPVSTQWVEKYVQAQPEKSFLTDARWEALCPNEINQGCFPDCQGAQSSSCQVTFNITGAQSYLGVTETVNQGMYVQRFITEDDFSITGPAIHNENGLNDVTCGLFTTAGHFIPPVGLATQVVEPEGPPIYSNTTPPIVSPGQIKDYSEAQMYQTGLLPSNTIFYMICFGYAQSTYNFSTNVPATGLMLRWPHLV